MINENLKQVQSRLYYKPLADILIKPLEKVMVNKVIIEKVPTGKYKFDKVINQDVELHKTKRKSEQVPATFQLGYVVALPINYDGPVHEGDTVVYAHNRAIEFDIVKPDFGGDHTLFAIRPYDVVALREDDSVRLQEFECVPEPEFECDICEKVENNERVQ